MKTNWVNLILMLDVPEHLVDPWNVLRRIQNIHLKPGGKMIISLLNARHFTYVMPLMLYGEFSYQERGILDKTHLRFFKRKSGTKMLRDAGLSIEKVKCTSLDKSLNSGKLNALTLGIFSEFLTSQFIYLASPDQAQGKNR
ncbi:methyltransferase domain-containing protein [Limnohabitans sp. 63ED37-2]|uniref:methyltransferase domain-containing protein n=1 Tax=Limnohabitans sp. 63ED37-2 TaxID=1678128 RepID=UPI0009EC9F6F|nr:methyltransferase domain-containing protein [Limnohabitans sp. 63ED37-2]